MASADTVAAKITAALDRTVTIQAASEKSTEPIINLLQRVCAVCLGTGQPYTTGRYRQLTFAKTINRCESVRSIDTPGTSHNWTATVLVPTPLCPKRWTKSV
uniref:Uncharacterized protein n=1 Tax=Anopheles albimanus TaxID=7167 RepID=A0A182FKZ5_ANOAL